MALRKAAGARKARGPWLLAVGVPAALAVAAALRGSAFAVGGLRSVVAPGPRTAQPRPVSSDLGRKPEVARWAESAVITTTEVGDNFLKVLQDNEGNWRADAVMAEIQKLEEANPTADPALSEGYLDGDWLQVSRPDMITEGKTVYTLGQLSFGMYAPVDMKMKIDKTTQRVAPIEGGNGTRSWDITIHLTSADERFPEFKAEMTTFGQMKPGKDKDGKNKRLEVSFQRGTLRPAPGTDGDSLKQWIDVFGAALKAKKQSRTIWSMLKNLMLRMMMGLRLPAGIDSDGTMTFLMKMPPHGYADILYIDDKLRVTKGNRGSIVVTTRPSP